MDFTKIENYDTAVTKVIPFSRTGIVYNGWDLSFGNMNPAFPVTFFGKKYPCPEYIYISAFYGKNTPECINIQKMILNHTGGAKTLKKKYRKSVEFTQYGRKDFNTSEWHYHLMLYAVWLKCLQNKEFAQMLLSIPEDYVIIENQNGFHGWELADWGCKNKIAYRAYIEKNKEITEEYGGINGVVQMRDNAKIETGQTGIWTGMNHQGKILMACREALRRGIEPPINYDALNKAEIYFYGERLHF